MSTDFVKMILKQNLTTIQNRVKPVAAVVVVGYGVKTYLDMAQNRRRAQMEYMEREAATRKQRNEMLMDMYGDRSSLDELEKAIEFYEKR